MTDTPDQPGPPSLRETASSGPWGGPVYTYRGAEIRCAKGGHVRALFMEAQPLKGATFGVVGAVTPLVSGRGRPLARVHARRAP